MTSSFADLRRGILCSRGFDGHLKGIVEMGEQYLSTESPDGPACICAKAAPEPKAQSERSAKEEPGPEGRLPRDTLARNFDSHSKGQR
jgi:hypothetical protein